MKIAKPASSAAPSPPQYPSGSNESGNTRIPSHRALPSSVQWSKPGNLYSKDISTRRAARKHDERSKVDLRIFLLVLPVRTQQINQLRHDLELELPRLLAERAARNAIERKHRASVRPQNLVVVPSTQSKYLRARSLNDLVEMEMDGIVRHSATQRIANVLIRDLYL